MAIPGSTQDHYAILEVPVHASPKQIKAAYFRLMMLHHPDKNNGSEEATAKTKQVRTRP